MEFYCPPCQKVVNQQEVQCEKLTSYFISMQGKRIWRIRFLNRFAYQYLSECQYKDLTRDQPAILSNATYWDDFNPQTFTGIDARGTRSSIFA
ncbi:hypothetical protein [Ammoniphilus sp. 3BR4]|uniref:hypothetical protein n=1 Tax=Ammoniphilus sp. 3BR4 TaxID=3158265 RepID=UPI0034660D00